MIIDSHAHLTDEALLPDIANVLKRAYEVGVDKIITIGTTPNDNLLALQLCDSFENVFAGIGVYPDECQNQPVDQLAIELEKIVNHPKVVGIGETGIDIQFDKNAGKSLEQVQAETDLTRQYALFELHIELAKKYHLPLIIHNRNADELVLKTLEHHKESNLTGVFHCFTSSWETAQKVLELGFYVSFSGIITYPSGQSLWDVVKKVPKDRFLVETDAPYLTPQPHRNKKNEPQYVKITMDKIAEVKQIPLNKAYEYAYTNTTRLFKAIK